MPEFICSECGERLFHENETTLKIQETIHSKFCRKKEGQTHSYMHRDPAHMDTFDSEREKDTAGEPILKR
ncbi:MAG: hypothetical protein D9C04_00655 [Nitrosopumilus sp. B06]|nr:MAG: hypothetical protein EB828_00075 [Nitrosopumilus sp. D6]RNJ80636.1 MAG: hypothetical protein D9C04_00655 [Nitrosopumilus sp. B06]